MKAHATMFAFLIAAASTGARSQETTTEFSGQSVRVSTETATLHCSKVCVIKIGPSDPVRVEADRITSDQKTGLITLEGSVRLVIKDGEVFADRARLSTDANGVQSFRSDEMRIVSPKLSDL